jgi:hypothetical protein
MWKVIFCIPTGPSDKELVCAWFQVGKGFLVQCRYDEGKKGKVMPLLN